MKLMILAAIALPLTFVSCAHSKGEVKTDTDAHADAAAEGHVCGPTCGCKGHGDKHAAEGHAKMGHTAENMKEHVDGLFAKLDTDSDRALTKEEVGEHHLSGKFDMADADADGKISYDEMIAFGTKMHAKMEAKVAAPAGDAVVPTETVPEAAVPAAP